MQVVLPYLYAFLVGGALCLIGQVLIDRTKLTPARILSGYVVAGVLLGALGWYQPLIDFAGAGATVPLTGFGSLLARGVREAVAEQGLLGAGGAGIPFPGPVLKRANRAAEPAACGGRPRALPAGFGAAETPRRPPFFPLAPIPIFVAFPQENDTGFDKVAENLYNASRT